MIIKGNAMERHPVEAGVTQGSPVSPIVFAIYASGLIKWVEEYLAAGGLAFVDELGWVATGSDGNQVVTILERCATKSIESACGRGRQFDTAQMEAALFMRRRGHKKLLRPMLTAYIKVRNRFIRINKEPTRWQGVWTDAHLTLQEHPNRCIKKTRGAEARHRTLTMISRVVPESVRTVPVACVQVVALYRSELWWDPKDVRRRDELQSFPYRQTRSILGVLPTTPREAPMRESGLTHRLVILDYRQQRFTAGPADVGSCKLKELHEDPSSGTPICGVVEMEYMHGQKTSDMSWPAPGEEPVVKTIKLDDKRTANRASAMLGKREESESWGGSLDVVERRITL